MTSHGWLLAVPWFHGTIIAGLTLADRKPAAAFSTLFRSAADNVDQKRQLQNSFCVIPAKAEIQSFQSVLCPGFRRGDG
jgi:hypothetical protein